MVDPLMPMALNGSSDLYSSCKQALEIISRALERCASALDEGVIREALSTSRKLLSTLEVQFYEAAARHQFLETVVSNIADGVIVADARSNVTFLNDAARKLLGESEDAAASTFDIRHPDGRQAEYGEMPLVRGLSGETFTGYEIELVRPDGTSRLLKTSGAPLKAADGSINGAVVVMHDLTRERDIVAQLEDQRQKLEQIVDNLPEGVIIIEGDSAEISVINRVARSMVGALSRGFSMYDPALKGMIRRPDGQIMDPQDYPIIQTLINGTPQKDRYLMVQHPDGRMVHVLKDTVPLLDQSAAVIGAMAVFRDITNIRAEHDRLQQNYEREHHLAEILQRSLLPAEYLHVEGFDMAASYCPAMEIERVGGDFYDSFLLPDGRAVICIGDVSGKGVEAAVFTSLARDSIRAYIVETPRPASVLRRVNECLLSYLPDDNFVTIFLGVLSSETGSLTYASAGHDPPLYYNSQKQKVVELYAPGRLAGIFSGLQYGQRTIHLRSGDVVFLYTDGLAEARHDGEVLGSEGLALLLKKYINGCPHAVIEHIFEDARNFAGGSLHDDAAAILVRAL